MTNTISFVSANFVAREVGYRMTGGWGQGDRATNEQFRPLETFAARFEAMLLEVRAMGFSAIDLWTAHLNPAWATQEHLAIARDLLGKHGFTVPSLAGGFGGKASELEATCRVARAVGARVLGGSADLLKTNRPEAVAVLREHGLVLAVENHPERTPEELLARMGGDEDCVSAAVDTGWFGTQGYSAARAIEALWPRVAAVHLKDVRAAGEHETCRFGEGVVPIEGCVRVLGRLGYTGPISVEHEPELFDPTEDIRAGLELLRGWLGNEERA